MKVWELKEGVEYKATTIYKDTYSYRIVNGVLKWYCDGYQSWETSNISYNETINMDFTEYTPPTDWSKVEVDTKILVRDWDNSEWIPRHFAIYKNGRIHTWNNGHTSFTIL